MDKHPQIVTSLARIVKEFYKNRDRKQVSNRFKKVTK